MDDARVHLCNFDLGYAAQYVEAGRQRSSDLRRVHVCNRARASPRVTLALQDGISFAIGRMSRSVLPPVIWMARTPARLRAMLVFAIVRIGAHVLPLPAPASLSLAAGRRT